MQSVIKKVLIIVLVGLSLNAYANNAQENTYLIQIVNQLNAIQPLILAAQKEQPANTRIQFHYTKYRDAQGKMHNGLLEDVNAIKQGIIEKINQTPVEPRVVNPIKGDYLDKASGANQP